MKLPSFTGFTATHRLFSAALLAAGSLLPAAQSAGRVLDAEGRPLAGVEIAAGGARAETAADGAFALELPEGAAMAVLRKPGYAPREVRLRAPGQGQEFRLLAEAGDTVEVSALRAGAHAPATASELDRETIARDNHAQDVPALLTATPAVTSYGEAGGSGGYSYFSLRGIGMSRINLTLDGVPLNDPEEMQWFFANTGDLMSSLDSAQVQRGVGTSTVGAAAWGGSVNFATLRPADDPRLSADLGGGSYGSTRLSLAGDSGEIGPGLALYGRVSRLDTDGYVEHSGVTQDSLFLSGRARIGTGELRASALAGLERTRLAYYGATPAMLAVNPRANGNAPEETDRFRQQVYQLAWSAPLGRTMSYRLSLYRNAAAGWFDLFDFYSGDLNRFRIDGATNGALVTGRGKFGNLSVDAGLHHYRFSREHAMDDRTLGVAVYANTGRKRGTDAFVKGAWDAGRWHLYGDLQWRTARFSYQGSVAIVPVSWSFLNPKAGVRFDASDALSLYVSAGRARREPARSDLLSGEDNASLPYDLRAVKPETVTDYEAGVEWKSGAWRVKGDLYAMELRHEIAATGELTVVGYPLRVNTERSHRRGVELEYAWTPGAFAFAGAANLSSNRIDRWNQYYDIYDGSGAYLASEYRTLTDVHPLLTPELILTQSAAWRSRRGDRLALTGRYVAHAQLDNTGAQPTRLPGWFRLDADAQIPLLAGGRFRAVLRLHGDNLLDRTIYAGGYSYPFLVQDAGGETRSGTPYLYPQVGRSGSALLQLTY